MQNVFTIIGNAWDYKKSQPVLSIVVFWLMFLPMLALLALSEYQAKSPYFQEVTWGRVFAGEMKSGMLIGSVFSHVVLIILIVWGMACCILVGKRLIQNRAGRARSSFKKVRKEAAHYVSGIVFTDILRGCITLLWSLLLIVPGVVYFIRTFFFYIAIVCEEKNYRGALNHSKNVVKGKTWTTCKYLLGICTVIFLPLMVIDTLIVQFVLILMPSLVKTTYLISAYLYSIGFMTFLLSSVALYAELKSPQTAEA